MPANTATSPATRLNVIGSPQDITLQELRIESFFPMDAATANVLRGWAG
jgi:hypothetical protein